MSTPALEAFEAKVNKSAVEAAKAEVNTPALEKRSTQQHSRQQRQKRSPHKH